MPRLLHFSVVSFRDLLATYAPVVLVVGSLLWIAYVAIDPTPPTRVVIAAGLEDSAYQDFAEKYREVLAKHHIAMEIRVSPGSMRNLLSLGTDKSDADIAFVQSGTTNDEASMRRGLVSLGSLFVEPVWIFYRDAALAKVKPIAPTEITQAVVSGARIAKPVAEKPARPTAIRQLGELRGLTLNVGPKGSGGPRLAGQLFKANRIQDTDITLSYLDDTPAVMKLLDGSLDALMFVTAPEAPMVQMLLQTPGIKLFDFDQAEAYSRRFPFLKHVVLPRGIVALEQDLPHDDVHLIAPTATLVARSSTHPAIIELLMQAATEVHGGAGWFSKAGEFPNDQYTEVPVSPVAERYFKNGPPFLQRYLPFWLANLIERMGVIIVPILALLIPLSRILPPLYTWRVRSRVYRWYGQLRAVESDVDAAGRAGDEDASSKSRRSKQLAQLADIETRVNRLVVPLSYADELYTLKLHIDRVRAKLLGTGDYRAVERSRPPSTETVPGGT
jgi:TRAP-type uncharacterized transport system substrate-binding protein